MADVIVEKTDLENAADAIREKLGSQDLMTTAEMADNISSIEGGGGKIINTDIYTFPNTGTSATSCSFSVNRSDGALSVEINPWQSQANSTSYPDGGNLTLSGKYPWELSNCNNGVFEFSYSVNGTTIPWQTVSVDAKTGGSFTVGSGDKTSGLGFMPLYTDWENMTFNFLQNTPMGITNKDNTSSGRSVSGKVYESSTKVEYLYGPAKNSTATYISNGMGFYLYHPCDGFTTSWPRGAGGNITETNLSNLYASISFGSNYSSWATTAYQNNAKWVYDATQNMLVSAVNKDPKISFYIKDTGSSITDPRPVIRLWISDALTLEEALALLAASKSYIVPGSLNISASTPAWSLPQEIRSAWDSATVINGQNSITAVSSPSSKFAVSGSVKAPIDLDEAFPSQKMTHIRNEMSMEEYDAYICAPEGYTPPSNITIW